MQTPTATPPKTPSRFADRSAAADADQPAPPARALFWLALVALAVSVATVIGMTEYSRRMERWIEHTTLVYQTTRSALLDLTGPLPRGPEGITNAPGSNPERAIARFDSVGVLTLDNPQQQTRIRTIRELAGQWVIAARAGANVAPALAITIESSVRDFLAEEERLYRERGDRFSLALIVTAAAVAIELALVGGIIVAYRRRILRYVAAANAQQLRLEEQATELEEQALELEVSNHELREAADRIEQERRIADAEALQREHATALLNASLDSAPVAFALVDEALRYLQVNARWAELTGVDPSMHPGRSFDELPFSRDAFEEARAVVARARVSGVTSTNVQLAGHQTSNAGGDVRHWLLSAAPIARAEQEPVGVAIALLDVTEHARTTNQLLHVQKMEAIARLAGGIAHDFNNSLAVINAYASMLALSDRLNDVDRAQVAEITETVQRAAGLTQQLLAFGRRQITQPRRLDVSDVVQNMVPVLRRLAPASIDLATSMRAPAAEVLIDRSQLEQILLNLVNNAIHAMPEGGRLTIATDVVDLSDAYVGTHVNVTPGRYVVLTISDSGAGMDDATMSRIFEPFFTTKEAGKGTGLGLASVYAIVKDASGHTWVYSEPGKGTEFKVYLPIAADGEPVPAQRKDASVVKADRSATVLLVEDDEKLRPAVVRLLQQSGYTVLEAANGNDALTLLLSRSRDVDLVITDLVMPGLSGRELSEIIAEQYPRLRVLLTSGYTDDGIVRRGLIERGYPFIQKPFTREQLVGAIDRALGVV